jgi:hypothetical protein
MVSIRHSFLGKNDSALTISKTDVVSVKRKTMKLREITRSDAIIPISIRWTTGTDWLNSSWKNSMNTATTAIEV